MGKRKYVTYLLIAVKIQAIHHTIKSDIKMSTELILMLFIDNVSPVSS